ncbi:MAG: pyridoxal-phosphate-dependent aminotransferase family protein [Candidatus Aminicenantia bacterium]
MIKKYYLLSPGPVPIPFETLSVAAEPIIHHRTAEFSKIFMDVSEDLKFVYQTKQDVYILLSSGTGGMEAAITNTLSPGDKVIVLNGGKFGERWAQIAKAYGLNVLEVVLEWGEPFTKEQLEEKLKENPDAKAVFTTLSETSSGSVYDIKGYGEICRNYPLILVTDAISGLGATPCPMDEWGIDILVSASQKALMVPPGLAYIAFSEKAWKMVETSKLPKFYFDIKKYKKNLEKQTTPFTPGISLIIQQKKSLELIKKIGLETLFEHHRILAEATREGAKALKLELLSKIPGNICTAIKVPAGIDGEKIVKTMRNKYFAYIAEGQEPYKGKIFRIAHLGYMGAFDIITAFSALEMTLHELGYPVEFGASISAAEKIFKEAWK